MTGGSLGDTAWHHGAPGRKTPAAGVAGTSGDLTDTDEAGVESVGGLDTDIGRAAVEPVAGDGFQTPAADVDPPADGDGQPAGADIDPAERTPRSFHLSRRLLERARAAAHWVAQSPDLDEASNISELVERALRREVERLEQQYHGGTPFPAVLGRMRTGPGASGVERIRRAQRARRRTT